jgi:poly(3-hydroxybutyrate) depolymerase
MTVFEMIKKEFNVDENRTYLMGHSMGGAGTIYLGVKYASIWAAIGAEAPATSPAGITPSITASHRKERSDDHRPGRYG